MHIDDLNDSNFLIYAAQHYTNTNCLNTDEFLFDIKKFRYLKKLITKYLEHGDLKERLILNHIIIIYNVFENEAATRMLFFKLKNFYSQLKPFLKLLERLPPKINMIDGKDIYTNEIISDSIIQEVLKKI